MLFQELRLPIRTDLDWLVKLSMKNRAFIALVTIVIMVLGLISLNMLRRELIPPVELPSVAVTATNPGASSEQMAQQVAEPIERQLTAVDHVTSTSSNSGSNFSMINLEMEDRKSTRLNSSHVAISYAVFCLKKKNIKHNSFS